MTTNANTDAVGGDERQANAKKTNEKKSNRDRNAEPAKSAIRIELERLCSRLALGHVLAGYLEKSQNPQWDSLDFERKVVSLLKDEEQRRDGNAVKRLRSGCNLPLELECSRFEDYIDRPERKIDPNVMSIIMKGEWMVRAKPADLVITGACGVGKSYVAACCVNFMVDRKQSAYFIRSARLFRDLAVHELANSLEKRKSELRKIGLLVLDDFVLEPIDEDRVSDLLDLVNDRAKRRPTIFTSQYTIDGWLERLGDSPLAQAVVDRIANSAYRLHIQGPSMRQMVS